MMNPERNNPIEKVELESAIDSEYEHLLHDYNPIDSGEQGLIYHLKFSELNPALVKFWTEQGASTEKEGAVKVLKLFRSGAAKHEFEAQKRAYDLVEGVIAKDPSLEKKYARIPKPIEYRKLKITPETRDVLKAQGAKLEGEEVELILMDYIEGDDFQELFYRWIINHAPEDKHYATIDANTKDFNALHHAVSGILEFRYIDTGKSENTDAEIIDRRRKIYSFLKRTGFEMPAAVLEQIRNTRKLLAKHDLYHNDEHERNFMLSEGQVFMIDFARASSSRSEEETSLMIDTQMEQFSPEFIKQHRATEQENFAANVKALASDPKLPARFASVFKAAEQGPPELNKHLANRAAAAVNSENDIDQFLGLLVNLRNSGKINTEQISEFLETMSSSLKQPILKRGKVVGTRNINPAAQRRIDSYKEMVA